VAAQIAGSVGLAGSANIGEHIAMFEAIHGSAPRRAGQNLANPSGLFLGAVMMLVHIGQTDVAERVHNAWLKTVEDGVHTYDIYDERVSKEKVGTKEFANAVVERLGQKPETLKPVVYKAIAEEKETAKAIVGQTASRKELVGVDVYVDWTPGSPDALGASVEKLSGGGLRLGAISNRGVKVWPGGNPETFLSDHWRCRFVSEGDGGAVSHEQVAALLNRFAGAGLDSIKTENLYNFDGKPGYSHVQE
jgi:isocitrate dehydrogenase